MIPKDNICELIASHKLPLNRGNSTVKDFLEEYYAKYLTALNGAISESSNHHLRNECYNLVEKQIPTIEQICNLIIETLNLYNSGKMSEFHLQFNHLMTQLYPHLTIKNLNTHTQDHFYYRIRTGTKEFSRKDLFHIPMNFRQHIKSYRYSIPGYPCLYLATGLELCYFECGMPKEFSYTSFFLNPKGSTNVKFIDFSYHPSLLSVDLPIFYYNYPDKQKEIDKLLINYLTTLPLRVACSLQVVNRDTPFIEEYIIPQQLLLWTREYSDIDGILYRSSSIMERAHDWNFVNLVMPAKELKDGYCQKLNDCFEVAEPCHVRVRDIIPNHKTSIDKVQSFIDFLDKESLHNRYLDIYLDLHSLCKSFLHMCNMLEHENYVNGEAINQTLDTLNRYSMLIVSNKDDILNKSQKNALQFWLPKDQSIFSSTFETMFSRFENEVRPVFFEFWSYESKIHSLNPIDSTTYQRIFIF